MQNSFITYHFNHLRRFDYMKKKDPLENVGSNICLVKPLKG